MQQNSSAGDSNLTISDNNGNPMASNNSSNITNIAGMVAGTGNDTNMVMQLMSMTNSITNSAMNNNVCRQFTDWFVKFSAFRSLQI